MKNEFICLNSVAEEAATIICSKLEEQALLWARSRGRDCTSWTRAGRGYSKLPSSQTTKILPPPPNTEMRPQRSGWAEGSEAQEGSESAKGRGLKLQPTGSRTPGKGKQLTWLEVCTSGAGAGKVTTHVRHRGEHGDALPGQRRCARVRLDTLLPASELRQQEEGQRRCAG